MKKILMSTSALLVLSGATLSAEDFQVRLGMSSTSGTFHIEDSYDNQSPDYDISGTGFEVSIVAGTTKKPGFNLRPVLTLQSNSIKLDDAIDTSDIMFLGEFELAYNINEYVNPFVGFYGGIGSTSISDLDESGLLTYDLGFLAGVSGAIYEDFGYYAKYTYGMKGYNIADDTLGIRQNPSTIKLGVSYAF